MLTALLILQRLELPPIIVIRVLAPYLDAENERMRSFVRDWFRQHDNAGADESPLKPVNYEEYAKYVSQKVKGHEDVPTPFVEYIYERSPERALLVFYRAHGQRDAVADVQAEAREVEAARQQLENPELPIPRQPAEQRQQDQEQEPEILLAEHVIDNAIWLKKYHFDERFQKALPEAKEQLHKLSQDDQWWARLYVAEIMRRHRELRQPAVVQRLASDGNPLVSKIAKAVEQ